MNKKKQIDITVLIPTYFRNNFLKRLLEFFASTDYYFNIIILDSTPQNKKNLEFIKNLSNNHMIEYYEYEENIKFSKKIFDGLKKTKTKYSVLCADDDYLIPKCLEKCVMFLNKNNDFTSATGISCVHHFSKEKKFSMGYNYIRGKSICKKSAQARFFEYVILGKKIPIHYAVHKTSFLTFVWEETIKYAKGIGYTECFPEWMSIIYGKMKKINMFYQSKEKNFVSWYVDKEQYKKMHSDENTAKLIEGIKKHIGIVDNITIENVEKFLEKHSFDPKPQILRDKVVANSNIKVIKRVLLKYLNYFKKILIKIRNFQYYFNESHKGCPMEIYHNGLIDFQSVKHSIMSANLSEEEMNHGRNKNKKLLENMIK